MHWQLDVKHSISAVKLKLEKWSTICSSSFQNPLMIIELKSFFSAIIE